MTSLIGGTRVSKGDARLHAYGTADELNSFIGWLRAGMPAGMQEEDALLERMQNTLFCLGGFLALDEKTPAGRGTSVPHEETEALECAIDRMEKEIPPVHAFVLPGGSEAISRCHICRTVCRRLERHMTDVFGSEDRWSEKEFEAMQFVNRLSDFLFILSKKIAQTGKKEFFLWKI